MLKRRFPEPEASGGSAKRARQLDRDRESLQQQGHRVARSQVEGIPRAWRLQIIDRERLVEPGTQIACVEERLWYQQPLHGLPLTRVTISPFPYIDYTQASLLCHAVMAVRSSLCKLEVPDARAPLRLFWGFPLVPPVASLEALLKFH